MTPMGSRAFLLRSAARYPTPRSTTSSISSDPALPSVAMRRSGFRTSTPAGGELSAALPGPAPVVRHRRDVVDAEDLEARRGERPDGRLAAGARTLHEHVDLLQAVLLGPARRGLGGELRRERRRLPRPLEPDVAGARPRQRVALQVGDRDDRVVERRLDVGPPMRDVLLLFPSGLLGLRLRHELLPLLPLHADCLLRSLPGARVGVRALPVHRERPAMPDALVGPDLDLA